MTIPYNHLRVRVRLADLVANFKRLDALGGRAMAVVKADAYGHGLVPVSQALEAAGADMFAVGTVAEGLALRDAGIRGEILALLGPVEDAEYDVLGGYRVIPVIHRFSQFEALARRPLDPSRPLSVALKWDTGMRRLGFSPREVGEVLERLRRLPGVAARHVLSHLATADMPEAFDFADAQAAAFTAVCGALRQAGLDFTASLANSAGILAHPDKRCDAQRAGIALYGANPFHGTRLAHLGEGLRPAMDVTTKILSVRDLAAGESVSYGRTHVAARDTRAAVIAAGYADAYSRGLSNKGFVWLKGVRVPILGRVCMQMTAVDVGGLGPVEPGEDVHLLGGEGPAAILPEELAGWWGTIPYEVFCLLGLNRREYA